MGATSPAAAQHRGPLQELSQRRHDERYCRRDVLLNQSDLTNITYTGTVTYTRGTGRFKRVRGSGTINCTTTDGGAHKACIVHSKVTGGLTKMTPTVKLYMFAGSGPSLTARLMLEHKGIEHRSVHMLVGPHAFAMLARGFDTMTVPALRIGDRRVQGTREISRVLDEIAPQPPLFDADPRRRDEIVRAERWGEDLQDAARRVTLAAVRRDPQAFWSIYRHAKPRMRPAQRVVRRLTTRLASAGHRATDFVTQEDLDLLPDRLDRIDAWIADGLLNSDRLNAADFQIAPSIALLLRFEDLAAHIEPRPAAQLAERVAPGPRGDIGPVLPADWLTPLAA